VFGHRWSGPDTDVDGDIAIARPPDDEDAVLASFDSHVAQRTGHQADGSHDR
jgi:hypothetical protein